MGALSLLRRGMRNLEHFRSHADGVQIELLLAALLEFRRALEEQKPLPPFPEVCVDSVEGGDQGESGPPARR